VKDTPNRFLVRVGACLAQILRFKSPSLLFRLGIAGWLLVSAISPPPASCQVPEFLGIYAVADGKLAALIGGKGTFTPSKKDFEVFDLFNMKTVTRDVLVFDGGDLHFLVFDAAVADASANLELYKLPYGRNLVTRPDALAQVGGLLGQVSGQQPRGQSPSASLLQKYVVAKIDALKVELLQKPVSGQPQMLQLIPASNLEPGMYCLFVVRNQGGQRMIGGQLFEWKARSASVAAPYCIDLATTGGFGGMMEQDDARMLHPYYLAKEKYAPCSGPTTPPPSPTEIPPALGMVGSSVAPGFCSDYDACLRAGQNAFQSSDWSGAISAFQAATSQRPADGEAWRWLGSAFMAGGRLQDAPGAWDRALQLGAQLTFNVCRGRGMRPCEWSALVLTLKEISFFVRGQKEFSGTPSGVATSSISNGAFKSKSSLGLRVDGKDYILDFSPFGVSCQVGSYLHCPTTGTQQKEALRDYVSRTITRLASGSLTQARQPSTTATVPPAPPAAGDSSCARATDLGYSILLNGRLYKVKGQGTSSADQVHVFFDDKGSPVTDLSLLHPLALAAWARENIVASSAARSEISGKQATLQGMISTSQALQTYEAVQDVIARAMAEAAETAVTGGTSLTAVVPKLTGGILRSQLMNAPKTLFARAAQAGLQRSLDIYDKQLRPILPPADSVALDANNLAQVKLFYTQAQLLDLPNEALAAALMPGSATELTNQALQSVVSQLIPNLPSLNEAVTLKGLWDLQKSLAQAGKGLPALQKYFENMNLLIHLSEANDKKIETWAVRAAQACKPSASPDQTVFLQTNQGMVRAKNFYTGAAAVTRDAVLMRVDFQSKYHYGISYDTRSNQFFVVLDTYSMQEAKKYRTTAESDLLDILGISRADACKLNVDLRVNPTSIRAGNYSSDLSSKNYGLSFCPSGLPFQ
jgi:hypothetical protein